MVRGALVDRYLKAGARLIALLDAAGVQASGALWLYSPEFDGWQLILEMPKVAEAGPRAAYRQVIDVFQKHAAELEPLELANITVKSSDDSPFDALHGVVTWRDAGLPRHFPRQRIQGPNGRLLDVEDSWIYRAS